MNSICDSLVNGEWKGAVAPDDRGFAYGDGVFETMLWCDGEIALLDRHLTRLKRACQRLAIPLSAARLGEQIGQIKARLAGVSPTIQRLVVKLVVTRGSGGRGYLPSAEDVQPTIIFLIRPYAVSELGESGVVLTRATARLSENPALAGIKHLNRLDYVLASLPFTSQPVHHQPLLEDQQSRIIESLHHNIFLMMDGVLVTPILDRCGVAGIMRELIIDEIAPSMGLTPQEKPIGHTAFDTAQEVFICNSVRGIWPVVEFEGKCWPVGSLTRQLQAWLRVSYGASYA